MFYFSGSEGFAVLDFATSPFGSWLAGAFAGGLFASLWTSETYKETALTLSAAGAVRKAARYSLKIARHSSHHGFPSLGGRRLPHIQVNAFIRGARRSGRTIVRIALPPFMR